MLITVYALSRSLAAETAALGYIGIGEVVQLGGDGVRGCGTEDKTSKMDIGEKGWRMNRWKR